MGDTAGTKLREAIETRCLTAEYANIYTTISKPQEGSTCKDQRSHNLRKFPQIFAVSMGVVLGIMRILCIPFKILLHYINNQLNSMRFSNAKLGHIL